MDNKTLIQKADLALADLISDGGYLKPAQAQAFIRLLIKDAPLMRMVSVVPMRAPKQQIDKIRFGSRIMRAGNEGTALPTADRSKPTTEQVELDAKLFKAEVNVSAESLEDSIERGQLKNTIMALMAERISLDIDEILVLGDTAGTDTYLAQFDGILKAATTNVVNAGTTSLTKNVLRDTLKALPKEYLRRKPQYRFLTSDDAELDYRDSLADRQTVLGDQHVQGDSPARYSSIPVIPIPMFPQNLGGGQDSTSVILTDPKNILLGIWRQIQVETDKDIRAGKLIIVVTTRMDSKFEHEPAVVKTTNVKVA